MFNYCNYCQSDVTMTYAEGSKENEWHRRKSSVRNVATVNRVHCTKSFTFQLHEGNSFGNCDI